MGNPFDRGALSLGDLDEAILTLHELVPSAHGACSVSERPRDVSTAGKQGDADAFSGLSHEVAVGDYLHYSLSDTTLKGFEVMFSFQDSERVKVPINRHPRSRITSSDYF